MSTGTTLAQVAGPDADNDDDSNTFSAADYSLTRIRSGTLAQIPESEPLNDVPSDLQPKETVSLDPCIKLIFTTFAFW